MKKGQIIENIADFGNNLKLMSVQQKHFDIMHLCVMSANHTYAFDKKILEKI